MSSRVQVLTDDGHEGVEVADVEALLRHVDEELDGARSVLLLHRLEGNTHTHTEVSGQHKFQDFFIAICNKHKGMLTPHSLPQYSSEQILNN